MREILFRGKRIDNGEWLVGMLARYNPTYDMANIVDERGILVSVVFETVGQYTGLTDKNGTKIFEGDIVVCSQWIGGDWIDECIEQGFVEMKHGAFGLHRKQGYYRPFKDWLEDYEYEVIGNIHDNPKRERMIELIIQSVNGCARNWAEIIADHLLNNGVEVLPCKVGDTIYIADEYSNEFTGIDECKVRSLECNSSFWTIYHDKNNYGYPQGQIGKTVFLTKEEAEKALERSKE